MASGIFSLMRSISGTVGAAVSVTIYDQRYFYYVQRYAEENDLNALGLQEALTTVEHLLTWAGDLSVTLAARTGGGAAAPAGGGNDRGVSGLLCACCGRWRVGNAAGLAVAGMVSEAAPPAVGPAPSTAGDHTSIAGDRNGVSSQRPGNGADAEPVHGNNKVRRSVRQ